MHIRPSVSRFSTVKSKYQYHNSLSANLKKGCLTNVPRLPYTHNMVKKNTAVRIKEGDLEELERLAKKEDETVSSLIRQAIREFLDRKKTAERLEF